MRDQLMPLTDLVSPRTGIIRSIARISRGTEEPNPPVVFQANLSHFDFRKAEAFERGASGKGETEQEAMLGAIGEAVERYCAGQFAPGSLLHGTALELGAQCIRPEELVLYSERQQREDNLRYVWPKEDLPISWVRGVELPSGAPVFVPASLTYLHYTGERNREHFTPPTSNGLAAGPDLETAVLSGLRELIERDAFLIAWMNRLPMPRVDYSSLGGLARQIRTHYAQFGIEALVFNLTNDIGIPVMMAAAVDRSGGGPAVVVGLSCHLDPATAVKKALMEVCQVRPSESLKYRRDGAGRTIGSYEEIRSMEDHALFAANLRNLKEFSFLFESGKERKVDELASLAAGDPNTDLDRCISALQRAGSRVAYADLTTPDLSPFGIRVIRAIATGLQPIHFGYGEDRLGGSRLFEVPARLGYSASPRSEADLNPCPHPLA